MTSPITCVLDDDKDLDDAALWAVIDSAAAAAASLAVTTASASLAVTTASKPRKYPPLKHASPIPYISSPSPQTKPAKNPRIQRDYSDGEVLQEPSIQGNHWPNRSPSLAVVKHGQRTPTTPPVYYSPETRSAEVTESACHPKESFYSPVAMPKNHEESLPPHSLSGRFPTVSLFKEYQNAAMAILEKSDYTMISGFPYIKKTGWRKIAFYFNISFEIKDKTIEFDDSRNVQRSEFVVRAHMQGGRFSDGWGSCEKREKRFLKPNHDIPSTAETRAKNKACQDLLGIGQYRPGAYST